MEVALGWVGITCRGHVMRRSRGRLLQPPLLTSEYPGQWDTLRCIRQESPIWNRKDRKTERQQVKISPRPRCKQEKQDLIRVPFVEPKVRVTSHKPLCATLRHSAHDHGWL
jgi:hypothetical protein